MNWLKQLTYFSHPGRTFFPWVALMGILIPMWTVTTTVNSYPFSNGHFYLFDWHGFGMLYGFFYTLTMVFCLDYRKSPLKGTPLILIFVFWVVEQIILYLSSSTLTLLLVALALHLLFMRQMKTNKKVLAVALGIGVLKLLFLLHKVLNLHWLEYLCFNYTLLFFCLLSLIYVSKDYPTPVWLNQSCRIAYLGLLITPLINNPLIEFNLFVAAGSLSLCKLIFSDFFVKIRRSLSGMEVVSYLVISVGLITHGMSYLKSDLLNTKATLHLLLAGGFSILVVKLMLEITAKFLGIKDFNKERTLKFMYIMVLVGGLIRFAIPAFYPERFTSSLHHSMGYWTLTFLIYLILFGHKCFKSA